MTTHKGAKLFHSDSGSDQRDIRGALIATRELWHNPVITSSSIPNTLNVYSSHEYGRDNSKYLVGYITKDAA
ncbi:hypothetical protein [Mycolicibacterium sp. BK634]|uniref:hypothetical protein n=1 Tax=Mycolicibacterium sp. BK634 TaxID=2587099 RepID=UPI001C855527|nr:hypothetical protein [Mycolicibacterium sp. BK634]